MYMVFLKETLLTEKSRRPRPMLQEIPYLGGRDRKCKLEEAIRINT